MSSATKSLITLLFLKVPIKHVCGVINEIIHLFIN